MKTKKNIFETALINHKIILLLVGILVMAGIYGIVKMPKQEFPTIVIRQGLVIAVYPGATSLEVEEQVTKPLERFLFGSKEINRSKTYSYSKDGLCIVYVELNDDVYDKDGFWSKLRLGLNGFKSELPAGVLALEAKDDIGDTSALLLSLESEEKTYRELEKYLDNLEDRLRKIESISNIRRYGVQKEQISVSLDMNKMARYGIDTYTVISKLFVQGFTTSAGAIDNSFTVIPLHVEDVLDNVKNISEQVIYTTPAGDMVRIKDIATLKKEYPRASPYITNNGKKCLILSIEMKTGNNIVQMGNDVNIILDEFEETLPDEVHINKIADQAYVVNESVQGFLKEILIAICSVIIIVILLMPIRVAAVSALSIPITIFSALGIFYFFKIELNTATLAALLVTLGMVVDDSIVIIDNYMEKLDEGMSRRHAAVASPSEFFMSVLSATLAISITFFPFLFTLTGMFGDFIKSFPWAIFIILSLSLAIALFVIPFLQYVFIRKGVKSSEKKNSRKKPLDYLQQGYDRLLEKCFAHPYITLSTGAVAVVVGVLLFSSLPRRLMPIAERNQFVVEFYLPAGTSISETARVADSLEYILRKDSRVLSVTSFIGQGSPRFHTTYAPQVGGDNFAQFIVNTTGNRATEELLEKYAPVYTDYFPGAYVRFKQMDYSNAVYALEYRLTGDDLSDLQTASDSVLKYLHQDPRIDLIRTNFTEPLPGLSLKMNEDEVNRLGLNKAMLSSNLGILFNKNGLSVSSIWEDDYSIDVVLRSDKADSLKISDIGNEYIRAGMTFVPLRQVVEIKPQWNYGQIVHRNGVRALSVVAEPKAGYNINRLNDELLSDIRKIEFPAGVTLQVGGAFETEGDQLPGIITGLIIAIVIIFFILLFHFKKISLAALVIASITLCVFGAAVGLKVSGLDMSLTTILGLVSLMGILVRNGIIMFDYAEELRIYEGENVHDAALNAGKRRMRPIFLTSAAASVGVLPMIIENNPLWAPMATVICFGTLITMVFISTVLPVAYWMIFKNTKRKRIKR